jgi:hypothetical protein
LGHKKKPDPAADQAKLADQNSDASFQSFLSRLRKAAAKRDMAVLPGMMTSNFGFSLAPDGEGLGVFDYWNRNNLWDEVVRVLGQKFIPRKTDTGKPFMVSPAEVSPSYTGYFAGLELVNGAWRFSYFISANEIRQSQAADPAQ